MPIPAQTATESNDTICSAPGHHRVSQCYTACLEYNGFCYSTVANHNVNCKAYFQMGVNNTYCNDDGEITELCTGYHVLTTKACAKNDSYSSWFITYSAVSVCKGPEHCGGQACGGYYYKGNSIPGHVHEFCFPVTFKVDSPKYVSSDYKHTGLNIDLSYSKDSGFQVLYWVCTWHSGGKIEWSQVDSSVATMLVKAFCS